MNSIHSILAAASALAFAASANATTISLTNGSLESSSAAPWTGIGWGAVTFTGWSATGPVGVGPVAQDGSQGLWSGWGAGWCGLSQNSSYTVASAGETLSAFVWAKTDANATFGSWFRVELQLNGGMVNATQTHFSVGTDWTQITTSYVTTAADIGKTVGMSFGTDGGVGGNPSYSYMDNAGLTTVPEPRAALLGGLGLLALLRRRRAA